MLRRFFGKSRDKPIEPEPISVELAEIRGHPELEFLLIAPTKTDIGRGLDTWRWIGLDGLVVVAVAAFGDTFLQAADGSILYLDTLEGRLSKIANGLPQFEALLKESDWRDHFLMAGLVIGARGRGSVLEPGECYDFAVAPILGGEVSVDAMQKISLVVKVSLAGQIHEQVKDLPDGTHISGFEITD